MKLVKDFLIENNLDIEAYYNNPEEYIESIKDEKIKQLLVLYNYFDNYVCSEPFYEQ